jgi:hypothetical protein
MLLFRSEEHARHWSGYEQGTEEGIVPLPDMVRLFSGRFFKERLEPDYFSHMREYQIEMVKAFQKMGSFWQIPRKK